MLNRHSLQLVLALALIACGATPNPTPPDEKGLWQLPSASAPSPAVQPSAKSTPSAYVGSASSAAPASAAAAGATAAVQTTPPEKPASSPQTSEDLVVANVAGKSIGVRELLAQWVHQSGVDALDQLDHLVLTRLVQEEARRLSVRVEREQAEQAYAQAVATIEKKITEKRPGITLDQWVDQMLGLDPLVYRAQLRADALNQLLAERVTRAFILESERAEVRVIVVKTEETLKEAQAALASGEEFAEVARRLSTDPSSKEGGRVPPVIRSATVMGKLAFETAVNDVGGPQFSQGAWLLIKVEARPQPLTGSWAEISTAVEASLAESQKKTGRTIEELEFSQWKSTMLRRYPVDLSPFLRLAGQPVK